jgi:hypothetical protein
MPVATGAAAAEIHSAFAVPVSYVQPGEPQVTTSAIRFHGLAGGAFGSSNAQRSRGYEFRVADLPFWPRNRDVVTDGDAIWTVIEVIDWPEAEAVRVMVEAVS